MSDDNVTVSLKEHLTALTETKIGCLRENFRTMVEERDKALLLATQIAKTEAANASTRTSLAISIIISVGVAVVGHILK